MPKMPNWAAAGPTDNTVAPRIAAARIAARIIAPGIAAPEIAARNVTAHGIAAGTRQAIIGWKPREPAPLPAPPIPCRLTPGLRHPKGAGKGAMKGAMGRDPWASAGVAASTAGN